MTLICTNYDHSQRLGARASEKGCAKPCTESLDFTSLTVCRYVVRESLLCWTIVAMTCFRTHPEYPPSGDAVRGTGYSRRRLASQTQAAGGRRESSAPA